MAAEAAGEVVTDQTGLRLLRPTCVAVGERVDARGRTRRDRLAVLALLDPLDATSALASPDRVALLTRADVDDLLARLVAAEPVGALVDVGARLAFGRPPRALAGAADEAEPARAAVVARSAFLLVRFTLARLGVLALGHAVRAHVAELLGRALLARLGELPHRARALLALALEVTAGDLAVAEGAVGRHQTFLARGGERRAPSAPGADVVELAVAALALRARAARSSVRERTGRQLALGDLLIARGRSAKLGAPRARLPERPGSRRRGLAYTQLAKALDRRFGLDQQAAAAMRPLDLRLVQVVTRLFVGGEGSGRTL